VTGALDEPTTTDAATAGRREETGWRDAAVVTTRTNGSEVFVGRGGLRTAARCELEPPLQADRGVGHEARDLPVTATGSDGWAAP